MVTLGGSISAGQGVSVSGNAYIPRIYDWIQAVFPNKKHRWVPSCFQQVDPLQGVSGKMSTIMETGT